MKTQQSFRGERAVGTLYLVPTPIGNLGDMTLRALEILRTVDLIAAEDTRNTAKLLSHFEIHCRQESFHEHNAQEKIPKLLAILEAGQSIAQVSDAGMPSISDPGHDLVQAAIAVEIPVVALPGPSAGLTALIASGLAVQPYAFYGFLPRKRSQQLAFFEAKKNYPETQIFYESPLRISTTISNLCEVYGDRELVLVRELTKVYEEYRRGTATELLLDIEQRPIKGECLLIVAGNSGFSERVELDNSPAEAVSDLIELGLKPNEAIKKVAKERQLNRQELYQEFHKGKLNSRNFSENMIK